MLVILVSISYAELIHFQLYSVYYSKIFLWVLLVSDVGWWLR